MKRQTTEAAGQRRYRSTAVGEVLQVRIERLLPGGVGIGHLDGMTVLAGLAAPGDLAEVKVERVRDRTIFASVTGVTEPGPDRIEPPCPHYGVCGGCDLQHLSYAAQVAAKASFIQDSLRRIGGVDVGEVEVTPSPKPWEYRSRVEWGLDPNVPAFGYRKRNSTELVDVTWCGILDPALDALRKQVRPLALDGDVPRAELRAATDGDDVALSPALDGFGAKHLTAQIAGERLRFDADSFFQANLPLAGELASYVVESATGGGATGFAVDLYCGVGLFTLPLARHFERVVGVEADAKSAGEAHENAKAAGLTNVTVSGLPVEQWLRRRGTRGEAPDVIVLDPPRTGVEAETLPWLHRIGPKRIVYVSCEPGTLARDIKVLLSEGYRVGAVRGFDMFPQTHHVEAVVTLDRTSDGA